MILSDLHIIFHRIEYQQQHVCRWKYLLRDKGNDSEKMHPQLFVGHGKISKKRHQDILHCAGRRARMQAEQQIGTLFFLV